MKTRFLSSLRFKLTIYSMMLVTIVGLVVMAVTSTVMRDSLTAEVKDKGIAVAKSIANSAEDALVGEGDELFLFQFIKSAEKSRGVVYALILDSDDVIRAHSDIQRTGEKYLHPNTLEPYEMAEGGPDGPGYRISTGKVDGDDVLDISVPVTLTGSSDVTLGEVHLGISRQAIEEPAAKAQTLVAAISVAGLLLGGIGAFILALHTVKPIKLLVAGVEQIGKGNLNQKIPVKSKDEIGELTTAFNDMAKGLREKNFIRDTFERYMSKQLADKLLADMDTTKLALGGERRYVTVLFTDIRGFTSMSERLDPTEVISLLNEYFSLMVEVVFQNRGWIDKFIGDAIMVIYGVPSRQADDAVRAVRTGLGMQRAMRQLNKIRTGRGEAPIHIGIGINSGTVVAGNVGSQERMNYTVIGDAVNLAAKLEPLSLEENVLISHETYQLIKDRFDIEVKGEVTVKGKVEPQKVYEVIKEKNA